MIHQSPIAHGQAGPIALRVVLVHSDFYETRHCDIFLLDLSKEK